MRTLYDDVVQTDYGQFEIEWSANGPVFDGDADNVFADQANGILGVANRPVGVYLTFGRRSGGSHLRIDLHDEQPGEPAEEWEDVVEASIDVPDGSTVQWVTWAAETSGPLDLPPGIYRVRFSSQGRDAGHANEFADGIVDRYLLELWPAPPTPDEVIRVGSENARYWHEEWGSRR
ncbi:hypothetical protein BCF74_1345 [Knoellia remsis]|uniref:Uncharacterized protein n=1 Tax=Knoellia remsis TaxID=407159 RepID=A0A2T0U2T1_9MICO|nr:hypothetical protein [Knoellia remsis]PRY52226.1 hypothetical protein BCF74_1345 [Knoellia remsis]